MSDPSVWRERGSPLLAPTGPGPLDGRSVAVKDLFAVGGFAIGAGNPRWLAQAGIEPADAWAVRALRAAGASIAGIARTDELAFSLSGTNAHYGPPPNPAAPDLISGGSSSGSAAAVALGQADLGLGTDTAGSIRVPASVCGLYGLRPTHGAVPLDGVLGLAPAFDTVGWLTRDPALLAAVGEILLPPAPVRRPTRLLLVDPPGPGEGLPVESARRLGAALGAELTTGPPELLDNGSGLLTAFRAVQAAEAWRLHGHWIRANPGALAPDVEARFQSGADVDPATERRARELITTSRERALEVLGEDTWLLRPATAGPGHRRDASPAARDAWRQATLAGTIPASAFGFPSCVLPGPGRPPVGWALVGPPGADRGLLAAAMASVASVASVASEQRAPRP